MQSPNPLMHLHGFSFCLLLTFGTFPCFARAQNQQRPNEAQNLSDPTKKERPSDDRESPANAIDPKWHLVLSEWSTRVNVLRNRDQGEGMGIADFVKVAQDMDVKDVELSSQLIEADLRRISTPATAKEGEKIGKGEKPSRIVAWKMVRDHLEGKRVASISIDHIDRLTLGFNINNQQVASNVSEYADWIIIARQMLGTNTFSLVVAESDQSWKSAAQKAADALFELVNLVQNPKEVDDQPDQKNKDRATIRPVPIKDKDNDANEKKDIDNQGRASKVDAANQRTLRILIESGEGFRSDPNWLAMMISHTERRLRENGTKNVKVSVLLNLSRQHVSTENLDGWLKPQAKEDISTLGGFIGGVVAETQMFVVRAKKDDASKVQILAERFVDYEGLLKKLNPHVANDTPVIVRYVGPSLYEDTGTNASVVLFKKLLNPERNKFPKAVDQ